jgi:outer membrane protein OmpA-like peptidoglycan-associated protein
LQPLHSRGRILLSGITLSASVIALQQCLALELPAASAEPGAFMLAQATTTNPNDPRNRNKSKQQQQNAPTQRQPQQSAPTGTPKQFNVQPRTVQPAPQPAMKPTPQPQITTAPTQFNQPPRRHPQAQPQITTNPNLPNTQQRTITNNQLNQQPRITTTNPTQPNAQPRALQSTQPPAFDRRTQPSTNTATTGKPSYQNLDQLRARRQVQVVGNQKVITEPDRRTIVREGNRAIIRHDETSRFRLWGPVRTERRGNENYSYVKRNGYQIITVTDGDGRALRRIRRGPDGREVVLFSNHRRTAVALGVGLAATGLILGLTAPVVTIPREQYIVDVSEAQPAMLYDALDAPPLVPMERPYSLDEIRYNVELRDRVRRLDLDSITFATGAWEITPDQYPALEAVAAAMLRVLARDPDAVFLIEGHTDAVGNDDDNLSLSDRRAESVAVILTQEFQIPPENLVTQGYGEQFLKVPTDGPSRTNRRVTVRNIKHLLAQN